jgi:hypothetical protein
MRTTQSVNAPLYMLDQPVVGIRLSTKGREVLVNGIASYERDLELGPILRVRVSRERPWEVPVAGREWKGKIVAGKGKDYDFVVSVK